MKTLSLEETIKWMERCIFEGADWNEDFWSNYTDALNYLKEYRKRKETLEQAQEHAEEPRQWFVQGLANIMEDHERRDLALTWDELCRIDMIGEPVWNGGTSRWMLLIDSGSDNTWIDLVNHAGGRERWIEHDLRLAPLYRKPKEK